MLRDFLFGSGMFVIGFLLVMINFERRRQYISSALEFYTMLILGAILLYIGSANLGMLLDTILQRLSSG